MRKMIFFSALMLLSMLLSILGTIISGKIEFARQLSTWQASCDEYRRKVINSGQRYLLGEWEDGVFVVRDPNSGEI